MEFEAKFIPNNFTLSGENVIRFRALINDELFLHSDTQKKRNEEKK